MAEAETRIKMIAVYARVSTARQEDENTIETQLFAIREFARAKTYTVVQEYIDDGWSGDMLARPALDLLRQHAKKRLWDAVLFYDPDRLARRYSFQELVMDELRDLRIEPLFVTIPPSRNDEDRLMYGVRGVFAEYERTKITERFRLGKVRKANEGHVIAAEAHYGLHPRTQARQTWRCRVRSNSLRGQSGGGSGCPVDIRLGCRRAATASSVVKRLQLQGIRPRKSRRGV
jgi:site-specific DNA recombinase